EQSKFGDGSNSGSGNVTTAVHNHYGPRKEISQTVGTFDTDGAVQELVIDFDGTVLGSAAYPLLAPKLPAGSIVEDVYLYVDEVFVLGGTTPAIEIGTEGSEVTNGFTITQAQAQAVGIKDVTSALSGTWTAGLAAETTVGIALSGTTPTTTTAGKARVVIRYVSV
ncbi:hypothetical protein KC678_02020, partial [Candidatus Dojkabacteria bacterium]|nr:hypothetical protein [Candidatus Dojkabacteria bacterium]